MNDISNQELKELILSMDKKMEVGFATLGGEIKRVEEKLSSEINRVEEKLSSEIKRVELEITRSEERLGAEVKQGDERISSEVRIVDIKLSGIDKRVSNEEIVSRGAFITIFGGSVAGLVKYFFFA